MKKQLPVMAEFDYSCPLEPFTIAFVYPRKGDAFVLKGGFSDIKNFLTNKTKTNELPACLVNFTYWRDKKAVEETRVYGLDKDVTVGIIKEKENGTRRFHYTVGVTFDGMWNAERVIDKWIRRRPRKWLKDLDAFLK